MKNIVCISNLDNKSTSHYSLNSWKVWCNKHNIEMFILDQNITSNPEADKFFIFDILEDQDIDYEQILLTNNLTIINPNTPNIFNITDNKISGVMYDSSYKEVLHSIEGYSKRFFDNKIKLPYWEFINSSLLVVNKDHKNLFESIKKVYSDPSLNTDNWHSNIDSSHVYFNFLRHKSKINFKILPYEWNMHDIIRKEAINNLLFTEIGWIYQFDFLSQYREQLMNQTYNKIMQ